MGVVVDEFPRDDGADFVYAVGEQKPAIEDGDPRLGDGRELTIDIGDAVHLKPPLKALVQLAIMRIPIWEEFEFAVEPSTLELRLRIEATQWRACT